MFTLKEGVKPMQIEDLKKCDYRNEKLLKQVKKMIELFFDNLDYYDAVTQSIPYKHYIYSAFQEFYGLKWKKLNDCPKTT